jgi:hypothetical protein
MKRATQLDFRLQSNDIIYISLQELGYSIAAEFAPPPSPQLHQYNDEHQYSDDSQYYSPEHQYLPRHSASSSRTSTPPPSSSTSVAQLELEAQHRQKLLERKRAVAVRNAQKADEFESLFSAMPLAPTPPILPSNSADDDRILTSNIASTSTLSPSFPPLPTIRDTNAMTLTSSTTSLSSRGRPVAADFETRAVQNLSALSKSTNGRKGGGRFVSQDTTRPMRLVIDLSDSESDSFSDDDDNDNDNEEGGMNGDDGSRSSALMTRQVSSTLSNGTIKSPLAPPTPISTPTTSINTALPLQLIVAVAAGGSKAKQALEEKESEIRIIMERIQQMEKLNATRGRIRLDGGTSGTSSPVVVHQTLPSSAAHSAFSAPSPIPGASIVDEYVDRTVSTEDARITMSGNGASRSVVAEINTTGHTHAAAAAAPLNTATDEIINLQQSEEVLVDVDTEMGEIEEEEDDDDVIVIGASIRSRCELS